MEAYRVFISSIMNRGIEDLIAEREQVRSAVEHFAPATEAWAFEAEPASAKQLLDFYIDAVKTSDLFVLVLGQHLTKPVQDEYNAARDHGKPILAFSKHVVSREANAVELLRTLDSKYDSFTNAVELGEKVRRALGSHMLSLIRGDVSARIQPGDGLARLRVYAREGVSLRILPMVPPCEYNSFRVSEVTATAVTFGKGSNGQSVSVPVQRIAEVLEVGSADIPTVLLGGRLQWLTLPGIWSFFTEKPADNDPLGFGFAKPVPNAPEVVRRLNGRPYSLFMLREAALLHADGWTLFYDDDGRPVTYGAGYLYVRSGDA